MKKLIQTLFFFLLATQICFGQWTNIGLLGRSITGLAVGNDVLFAATGDSGCVLRSLDGGNNWLSVTPIGLISYHPTKVAISPSSGSVFFNDEDTLYRSTDNGATWSPTFTANFLGTGFAVDHNGIIFAGYHFQIHWNGITQSIRSLDDGISWTVVGPIGTGTSYAFRGESVITLGWAFDNGMINISSDSGSTWQKLCDGAPGWEFVSWNSDGAIVCGWDISGLYRSTDQCTTWTKLSSIKVTDILSLSSGGMLVTTNDEGIFLFSEEGDSIGFFNEGLNNLTVHTIKLDNGGYVYVGTDDGVWRRPLSEIIPVELTSFTANTNGKEVMLNWSTATELNNQLFEVQRSFEGSDFATIGFVNGKGTTTERQDYSYSDEVFHNGKYYYRLKQIDYLGSYEYSDVVEIDFRTFNSYLLEQNYPNPFNPNTTIGFGIQNKSNVKITILNAIGEEVVVLLNEEREPGFHQVEFNASTLPSGVYFYQLKAEDYVSTKKMILLK